jgi:putative NADH-flavin reductase
MVADIIDEKLSAQHGKEPPLIAFPTSDTLEQLQKLPEFDWSFLAPSAKLEPGQRTEKFRLGGDQLLVDANGESRISVQDYAVAMIDELEQPAHIRQRFTVGY